MPQSFFLLARLLLSLSELPKETTELKSVTVRFLWCHNVIMPALGQLCHDYSMSPLDDLNSVLVSFTSYHLKGVLEEEVPQDNSKAKQQSHWGFLSVSLIAEAIFWLPSCS